jgi:radical SAM superfamily enzyme YgiQ (UPF0313 family)
MAHILFVSLYDEWCLGIRSLSSVLRNQGHKVSLTYFRDMAAMNDVEGMDDPDGFHHPPASVHSRDIHALLRQVQEFQPGLIGFSFMSNFHGLADFLTRRLKKEFPRIPVIWGGSDATVNPDLGIRVADYVCQGEGEEATAELVEAISTGGSTQTISNIWVRTGETVISNAPRASEKDLDVYPFTDFEQREKWYLHDGKVEPGVYPPLSHLHTNYPTLTSRGCPYSCSFCCNSNYRDLYGSAGYVRRHSVDYVIRELKHRKETFPGLQFVEFHDDVFTFKSTWLQDFASRWKEEINLPFFAYTHPSMCKNEDLEALHRAGWTTTVMGVQSGSEEILKMYDRRTARQRMIDTAHLLTNIGVQLVIDLIGNNPMETDENMRETFEMLLEFPNDFTLHEVNPLAMYRNFEITRIAEQRGLLGEMLLGRNAALAPVRPQYRFWNAMWTLTQFGSLSRETLLSMADDAHLHEHPGIVEDLAEAFVRATYVTGTRVRKDSRLQELEEERRTLEGSRAFRLVNRLRKARNYMISHLSIKNGNTNQPTRSNPQVLTG